MADNIGWRSGVTTTTRFENVQRIQKGIEAAGETSKAKAQKAAFAGETEAYQDSHSLEAYTAVCLALSATTSTPKPSPAPPTSSHPSTTIGPYHPCHLIATSPVSSVYHHPHPTQPLAIKLITSPAAHPPHNSHREAAILASLTHPNIIPLLSTHHDTHNNLILTFPYHPLTLATALTLPSPPPLLPLLHDLFTGLAHLHAHSIIHRDIKPSNLLLSLSPSRLLIADFGTAWHPTLSPDEPPTNKCLDVGTGAYRAPETLFGDRAYTTKLDMWAAGCVVAECVRQPPSPLFESRGAQEDGNQLGLILSIFKSLGTPTPTTWPSATTLPTPPFEWYTMFPPTPWTDLLAPTSTATTTTSTTTTSTAPTTPPDPTRQSDDLTHLIASLLVYEPAWRIAPEKAMEILEGIGASRKEDKGGGGGG